MNTEQIFQQNVYQVVKDNASHWRNAWLKQPSILLLDEPTANMDEESRRTTEDLLCKFKEIGTALLIASHDLNHFHHIMDKRLVLQDGKIKDIKVQTEKDHNNISQFPKKRINQ